MARSRANSPREVLRSAGAGDGFAFERGPEGPEAPAAPRRPEGGAPSAIGGMFPGERIVAVNAFMGEDLRRRARELALRRGVTAREVYALAVRDYVDRELGGGDVRAGE